MGTAKTKPRPATVAPVSLPEPAAAGENALSELGEKIFLDRYALKDASKKTLAVGDTVVVCTDVKTGQREIGTVAEIQDGAVAVRLRDGTIQQRAVEHVDKPLETSPEQMMARVARGIAEVEGDRAAEWEENFRWLLDGWKFVPAGRILTAAGTGQALTYYNCMPPDQEILTASGYQPIGEVQVGDLVVTHRNRLRQVLHKFERDTEETLYILKARKLDYDLLRVTGEHKVFAIRSQWVNAHRSRDGLRLKQEPAWIPAQELKPGDFVAVAYDGSEQPVESIRVSSYVSGYEIEDGRLIKPPKRGDHGYLEEGGTHHRIKDELAVDEDLCYLFGRWLGDGCVTHRTKTDIPSGIKIVFNLDEREEAERVASLIESAFGVTASVKLSSTGRWIDVWTNSMPLGQFFKAYFGCYSYGKRIPQALMRLPRSLALSLLKGLFTADGYVSGSQLGICLSNRTLAVQVHQMLLRLGHFFSINENTHRLARRPAYRVYAMANECLDLFHTFFGVEPAKCEIDQKYYLEHDGLRWVRIEEIAVEEYQGSVLDLEVEEDHSFVSAGLVVSNCYVVPSPQDARKGIVDTLEAMMEIMSRGGGVGINISSLRPRHAYVKGVNGRSSGSVSWGALYSFVTGLIEQGGCLTPDSLVFTEKGLLRLDEIVTHPQKGWREHALTVMTDEGDRRSGQAYNNGVAETLTVRTDMGLTLTGTPNHKVKVMTAHGPEWREIRELETGDALLVKLGQHRGQLQPLLQPTYIHHNQDHVGLPSVLDEELAFFLGYFMGDGFMTAKDHDWRLGVTVAHTSYLMDEMPRMMERLFPGANVRKQQKRDDGSATFIISNRALKEFLCLNGLEKPRSTEVGVPRLIRQSHPSVVAAFLRGLFEADGGLSHGYPSLVSTSRRLIDEVATLLIGLGCPVRIDTAPLGESSLGNQAKWRLRVHSFRGLERWNSLVRCDARSRFAACQSHEPDLARESSYLLPNPEYWIEPVLAATALPQKDRRAKGVRFTATDQPLRRSLLRYQRGDRNLTLSAYTSLCKEHPEFAEHAPPINDLWFVSVDQVEPSGPAPTMDLEVDENHTYLANGLVTHNSRRGALMLILNVWHPDVLDFINSKREAGRITNANISVGITDDFMAAVEADREWELVFPDTGDPSYDAEWDGNLDAWRAKGKPVVVHKTRPAREIWNAIIESAWASAEPGVFFVDRYNRMSNSWYYAPITCTNPCVTAETLVSTSRGLERIADLAAHPEALVALDDRLSPERRFVPAADVFGTGVKPVYRLRTREGYTLRLTADHRVRTDRGWVPAGELAQGDGIHIHRGGGGFGRTGTRELGEVLGWLVGDGTIKRDEAVLSFFGEEKQELAPVFAEKVDRIVAGMEKTNRRYPIGVVQVRGRDEARVGGWRLWRVADEFGLVGDKLRVPERLFTASRGMQAGFLAALFTADGQVNNMGEHGCSVRLSSKSEDLLVDVQRLLLNFGIASTLYHDRKPEKMTEMPDGKGGVALYHTAAYHDLAISKDNLARFRDEIGFLLRRKQEALCSYLDGCTRGPYREDFRATFESLEYLGAEEVYDLTEPTTHSFVANGIVVHNCGEQGLPAWGVCNLGAVNLAKFVADGEVQWDSLGKAIRYAVRFLDDVIDATPYFFEENEQQQKSERRVGLNTMGLAEMLIRLGIRYGTAESEQFIDELYEFIARESYTASADLAVEKGAFPSFDAEKFLQSGYMQAMPESLRSTVREKGMRNVTLLTQAPNGTIGTMVGTSTGIEPYYSWTYFRKSRLGVHEENVAIVQEWEERNPGEPLPDFFVAAMDLTPEEHVRVQAAVQRWVDSSISKTCNVPNSYTIDQTRRLYELMYRLGCKGGTIYRDGSRDEQVLQRKEKEPEQAAVVVTPAVDEPKVRPRPYKRFGVTVSKKTPAGTAHITMNNDDDGRPFEVFVDIGKGGTDVKAMAEAIGRLMSLVLRIASPLSPLERIREMINQMKGIGGARWVGFGRDRVRSFPDAVAQALEEHYGVEGNGNGHVVPDELSNPIVDSTVSVAADLCPNCGQAAFVHEEGCMTCHACGHSEC